MNIKNILLSCVIVFGGLSLSGCYTQLAMFHPQPESDDSEEFYSYSSAGPLKSIGMYAQDGMGTSLGLAYQMMYNRFSGFSGFGNRNRYNYYNPYGGYYNSYTLGGYTMYVPTAEFTEKGTPRTWSRNGKSPGTNLTVTRTRTNTTESSNNDSGQTNSSNVSSTRSSSGGSSSSSSSSGGKRATRRN